MTTELGTVLYYRDRAIREYHFYKMPEEVRKALAEPTDSGKTEGQSVSEAALVAFLAEYDLPELQPRIPRSAAQEYMTDYKAGRVPKWAQRAVKLREVRAAARG